MRTKHVYALFVVVGMIALAACSPQESASTATISESVDEPITLRMAVADEAGTGSSSVVLDFIEQVRTRSDGNITIEPVWDAGANTRAGYEQGVVAVVKEGEYELGSSASRAFDLEDVSVFQPLQTPYLIDNDALAVAVATSDSAAKMLEGLAPAGMVGLVMWPDDLRHPFSVIADKPLLSPDDFAGATIRTPPSGVSHALVAAMGGRTTWEDSGFEIAESGLRQSNSIMDRAIVTGNVTFFPKYFVLFANGEAFERLSEGQRAILREAATAVQDSAIAGRPSDVDEGAAWCDQGSSIVLASDEQLAAFVAAAQPVIEQIEAIPANAEVVAALRELKANTPPSAMAAACTFIPDDDGQTWSPGPPPNGVWKVELTPDDLAAYGLSGSWATDTAGAYTLSLNDGAGVWSFDIGAGTGECEGDYSAVDDLTTWQTTNGPCAPVVDTKWRLADDGLHFLLMDIQDGSFKENRAILEAKPWQKVEE